MNMLCTTLLVIASLHVGLVYPLKSSSRIELETHEAAAEEDASERLADLEKELNAMIEDTDVDNDNKAEVLDADKSFMQDRYEKDEDGMTQDDEDVSSSLDDSKSITSQNDDEKLTIQGCGSSRRRYYYRLYLHYYRLACRQRKLMCAYRRYCIRYRRAYSRYRCYLKLYLRYRNLYRRTRG